MDSLNLCDCQKANRLIQAARLRITSLYSPKTQLSASSKAIASETIISGQAAVENITDISPVLRRSNRATSVRPRGEPTTYPTNSKGWFAVAGGGGRVNM